MATRQALVAVLDQFEGPWQRARGHEKGIIIKGLGEGEVVVLECESLTSSGIQLELPQTFTTNGHFPFIPCFRFRFVKLNGGVSETSVEIEL